MLLLYSFLLLLSTLQNEQDIVVWQNSRKLEYSDFKMDGTKIEMLARSNLEMVYSHSIRNDTFRYDVYPVFYKKYSFINELHPMTLLHEQIHFDIMEVCARLIRKKFRSKEYSLYNDDSITMCINKINEQAIMLNRKFDSETETDDLELSTLKKWNDTIQNTLNSLSEFENKEGYLFLK